VTSGASIDQPFLMHKHLNQKNQPILDEKITEAIAQKIGSKTGVEPAEVHKTQHISQNPTCTRGWEFSFCRLWR